MSWRRPGPLGSRIVVLAVYLGAVAVAWFVLRHPALAGSDDLRSVLAADVLATVFVFVCSVVFANASLYDPYWSVAPPLICLYVFRAPAEGINGTRIALVTALITLWGIRLTWNWLRGWRSLEQEDWRYRDIHARTGVFYPLVNLVGIQLIPTLLVFAGCLPLFAVAVSSRPLNWLDGIAASMTFSAILLEAAADRQLADFRAAGPEPGAVLQSGAWALSRHPNYLGEILFWWGLFLFALAAGPQNAWTAAGAGAITILFLTISLPLIEKRMARRSGWADYKKRTPILFPWPKR